MLLLLTALMPAVQESHVLELRLLADEPCLLGEPEVVASEHAVAD